MKVDVTDLSPVKKTMSIEVDADLVAKESKAVLSSYAARARIPGFRPGKAPLSMIKSRYKQEVEEDVRERVMSRYYRQAAREKGLMPLGDPVVDDVSFTEGEPLRFTTTFEVLPEIKLKDYKGLEVRRPAGTVGDAEVDQALEELRQSRTQLKAVEEGHAAATGDVLVADLTFDPDGGERIHREKTYIEVGNAQALPAFNEAVEGATSGQQLEFSLEYPAEYPIQELAGKTVRHEVQVHEIKRPEVPELDDEFAKDLGDFDDLAALKERLRKDLQQRKEQEADNAVRNAVLDKVLLDNPIVLPEILVDAETRQRLEDMIRDVIMRGMDPEKLDLDWAELRKRQEEPARKSVHARLILDQIAADEQFEVSAGEVDERIRNQARRMKQPKEKVRRELEKHGGVQALKTQILREKSLDLLTSVANIQNEE